MREDSALPGPASWRRQRSFLAALLALSGLCCLSWRVQDSQAFGMKSGRPTIWNTRRWKSDHWIKINRIAYHKSTLISNGPLRFDTTQKLGPDKRNVAVLESDLENLAAEPLPLRLDKTGRTILESENVGGIKPFSLDDAEDRRSSSKAAQSLEELSERYLRMDRSLTDLGIHKKRERNPFKEMETEWKKFADEAEYRAVRTYSWNGGPAGPTAIVVIVQQPISAKSRKLVARAIYETQPSGLALQICRERVGQNFLMPREHVATVADYWGGHAATNPSGLDENQFVKDNVDADYELTRRWFGNMSYAVAFNEFLNVEPREGAPPKMICLGDVLRSRQNAIVYYNGYKKWYVDEDGELQSQLLEEDPALLAARAKQFVRGLMAMASVGHQVIVAVTEPTLSSSVAGWLESAGAMVHAVADASEVESGRVDLAQDVYDALEAATPRSPAAGQKQAKVAAKKAAAVLGLDKAPAVGAYLNEEAMSYLKRRRDRVLRLTRVKDLIHHIDKPKVWRLAEMVRDDPGSSHGPEEFLPKKERPGLVLQRGLLEIPNHYLRDVGMEAYALDLWDDLEEAGFARVAEDVKDVISFAAGEGGQEPPDAAEQEGGEDLDAAWEFQEVWE